MPIRKSKIINVSQYELEEIIEKALEKQRRELFGHIKTWTGLDPEDANTGFKIRKAFEFASSAQDGFEKAIKKTVLSGLAAGFLYGLYYVVSQMFGKG